MSSAEFVRHFGGWQDRVSRSPIVVTHHGRERLVVLSPEHFAQLAFDDASPERTPSGFVAPAERGAMEIVADNLEECFLAFDHDLRVVHVNAMACSYLRMGRHQLEGRALEETVPQSSGSLACISVARALETGQPAQLEVESLLYRGRWLRVKTFPFPTGSACLFRDVTDEVERRDAIDVQQATRQALLAHGLVGRCVLSARATFREVDAAFAALVGLEPAGLLRAPFRDIFPMDCRAVVRENVEAVLEEGEPCTFETRMLHRGHAGPEVRLSLAPLAGIGDRGVVVIATRR
ncbi:PAS domain-containing protein [Croceibacterium sp. TMG7-5b_MA50]|uniref:PAS domain-containing protein n=1 Tax=Croceibacterium sp. TMG7-5b_MA50 TaxID=3121290 RepID=UPI003221E4EF